MIEKDYKVELTISTFIPAKDMEEVIDKIHELLLSLKDPNTNNELSSEIVDYQVGDVVGSTYYNENAIKYDRGDYEYFED